MTVFHSNEAFTERPAFSLKASMQVIWVHVSGAQITPIWSALPPTTSLTNQIPLRKALAQW